MMNIGWSSAFQVGVECIDTSHEDHLDLIKALGSMIRRDTPPAHIHREAEILLHDMRRHQEEEERMMAHLGYPDLTDHQAIHSFLMGEISGQLRHFGPGVETGEMLRATARIAHLTLDHIIRHDLGILTFMQGRGLTEARLGLMP